MPPHIIKFDQVLLSPALRVPEFFAFVGGRAWLNGTLKSRFQSSN